MRHISKYIFILLMAITVGISSCYRGDFHDIEDEQARLEERVILLEEWQNQFNESLRNLNTLMSAIEGRTDYLISVETKKVGYRTVYYCYFKSGKKIEVSTNDLDAMAYIPKISIQDDGTGNMIWMVQTINDDKPRPLLGDDGKPVSASLVVPQTKIENGTWWINNGTSWEDTGVAVKGETGEIGKDGDNLESIFERVEQKEHYVFFYLKSDPDNPIIVPNQPLTIVTAGNLANIVQNVSGSSVFVLKGSLNTADLEYIKNSPAKTWDLLQTDLKAIPAKTFENAAFKSMVLPQNTTMIGAGAFSGSDLENITLMGNVIYTPNANDGDPIKTNNTDYFSGCKKLKKVIYSKGITGVSKGSFYAVGNGDTPKKIILDLAHTVKEFGNYSMGSSGLKILIMRHEGIVGRYDSSGISGMSVSEAIYVPDHLVESYKINDIWKDYADIITPLSRYTEK